MIALLHVLLDSSIRISVAALAVGLVLVLGRAHSSSLRHAAWVAVLCAMPLMPILPYVVPSVPVPIRVAAGITAVVPMGPETPAAETPAQSSQPSAPMVPAVAKEPQSTRPPIWTAVVWFVYVSGVLALFSRLLAGWLSVRRVLRSSRPIWVRNTPVYESTLISTPVTVGLNAQKVLLPSDWRGWSEEKLRAVLAHELAHVARRDTITSLLAHVNRCVFWFHPLAWWLERQLAIAAEQACDDAGVRAIGESRKYAEVLLDMAQALSRRGSRLSLQGVGVDGTGLLGRRIDRILRGAPFSGVSRTRKALVAFGCAAAIFLVAACRQQSIDTGKLKADPQYAAQQATQKAAADFADAARQMDARQVADLEALVDRNPQDLDSRKRLMIFYQSSGRNVLGDERTIARFRVHKLWFIQNHPEDQFASLMNPLSDPDGYEHAKRLWLAVLERKDTSVAALSQAAAFFEGGDPRLAEKILLRAQAAEPDGKWSGRFGRLYASVLAAAGSETPYSQEVRKRLEESRDPALLSATGVALAVGRKPGEAQPYLGRALQLDPNSQQARMGMAILRGVAQQGRMAQAVGNQPSEAQYKAVTALPGADRFQFLPTLAERAYIRGDMLDYYDHNPTGAREAWELARRYAQDALRLAPRFGGDANYGAAIHRANMTLGMVAMRVDGDKKAATKYLLAASRAPSADDQLDYLTLKLPVALLKYGGPREREAVIEYLERYGKMLHRPDLDLLHAAQQLRQGYMPIWYQSQAAKLK